LLSVKLIELVLRAARPVLLLLLNLQVRNLWLLHHVLQKHLLVEMAGDVGFVRHVYLFLPSAAASLVDLVPT